jgi:hypothetical protein
MIGIQISTREVIRLLKVTIQAMKMMKKKHGLEEKVVIEIMVLGTIVGELISIGKEDMEEILVHMVDGQDLTLMVPVIGTVTAVEVVKITDQDQVKQREIQMDPLKKTLLLILHNQQLKQMRKTFKAQFKLTALIQRQTNF